MVNDAFKNDYTCDDFNFKFIKINNNYSKNEVNIVKLFANIKTSIESPFTKLFINSYDESYYKLYDKYYKDKLINVDKCLEWIKGIYTYFKNESFNLSYKNTFSIIKKYKDDYFTIMINIFGEVSIIINNIDIDINDLNNIIDVSNVFIKDLNNNNIYSSEDLNTIDFKWSPTDLIKNNIDTFNYILKFENKYNLDEFKNIFYNLVFYTRIMNEKVYKKKKVYI